MNGEAPCSVDFGAKYGQYAAQRLVYTLAPGLPQPPRLLESRRALDPARLLAPKPGWNTLTFKLGDRAEGMGGGVTVHNVVLDVKYSSYPARGSSRPIDHKHHSKCDDDDPEAARSRL